MNRFAFARPTTLAAASDLVREHGDATLLAGGQTLLPTMKLGLAAPGLLVDLDAVAGLDGIDIEAGVARIGAMCRHADVAASPGIATACPGLSTLAAMIGDPHVRNRGTIGGSIANNDPAADYPAACLGLDATILTDRRAIAAGAFFRGLFETALEPGEIVREVVLPLHRVSAYAKFRNKASRFALVGVFVARAARSVRVAVTGAGANGVFRWRDAEDVLAGTFDHDALRALSLSPDLMLADIHAQADYRAHMVKVMAMRAVRACLDQGREQA